MTLLGTPKMNPEEFVNACVGGLYRYRRLAVQDQLPRIGAATHALRSRRDLTEKDEGELLFGPRMSNEDFREQLSKVIDK